MSNLGEPDHFRIASMEKKRAEIVDLMATGPGTPWEDAGSLGYFKAFFNTCFGMMGSPVKTLWLIRRPDTTKDARGFVIGCGICWGISVAVHSALYLFLTYRKIQYEEIDYQQFWINTGLQAVIAAAGVWLLMKIVNSLYFKLTVLDSASKATPIISYNVLSYCLAPTILAMIPTPALVSIISYSQVVALLWIFLLWIVLGIHRLRIKPGGAIIATVLTFACTAGIVFGVYYVGSLTIGASLNSMNYNPPPPPQKS